MLGDAEAVIDRAVSPGCVEPGRAADIRSRDAGDVFQRLGRVSHLGDEFAPLLERLRFAAFLHVRLVDQAFGDNHMSERIDYGNVGAWKQRQMVIRLNVRRLHEIDPARIDDDEPRTFAQPGASSATRKPDARRSGLRR